MSIDLPQFDTGEQRMTSKTSRRNFLKSSAMLSAATLLQPHVSASERTMEQQSQSPNARPRVGCIGQGGMGTGDARAAARYGDIVAVCDVDRSHAEAAQKDERRGKGKASTPPKCPPRAS